MDRTKIIDCSATYVFVGELADAMKPTSRLQTNLIACGIEYINKCMEIDVEKIIMSYVVTTNIWDGDYFCKILRSHFTQSGDFKLALKKYTSPLFPITAFISTYYNQMQLSFSWKLYIPVHVKFIVLQMMIFRCLFFVYCPFITRQL